MRCPSGCNRQNRRRQPSLTGNNFNRKKYGQVVAEGPIFFNADFAGIRPQPA